MMITIKVTHNIINRAINFDGVINVQIYSIPDCLHHGKVLVLVADPWSSTCSKPLLICSDELLLPVIIVQCALREIAICILCWAFTTLDLSLSYTPTLLLGMHNVRVLDFDCHLEVTHVTVNTEWLQVLIHVPY
jgi:hypothetical protein